MFTIHYCEITLLVQLFIVGAQSYHQIVSSICSCGKKQFNFSVLHSSVKHSFLSGLLQRYLSLLFTEQSFISSYSCSTCSQMCQTCSCIPLYLVVQRHSFPSTATPNSSLARGAWSGEVKTSRSVCKDLETLNLLLLPCVSLWELPFTVRPLKTLTRGFHIKLLLSMTVPFLFHGRESHPLVPWDLMRATFPTPPCQCMCFLIFDVFTRQQY